MTQYRTRENATYRADDAVKQLTARGIDLPDTVADAVDTLTRVRGARPAPPAQTALRDLIRAGASQADINAALLADLGYTRLHQEWQQAVISTAAAVLRTIQFEHDDIYPQLKALADAQIEHVQTVASLGDETLETLVVAGRHADAEKLATIDVAAAELHALYEVYTNYLTDGGYTALIIDGVDCTRWQDPRPVEHHAAEYQQTIAGVMLGGLRHGGRLWYPTAGEAVEAAEWIARDNAATARRLAAANEPQGLATPGDMFA